MHDASAYCAELVRKADRDRFIATLFAPAERRNALYALYAFNAELARVRDVAHAALPGEIRLQWWSDVVRGDRAGEAAANPVAAALLTTIERHNLAPAQLADLIEARRFDLYDEPMATLADLEVYARRTSSALISLAARILAGTDVPSAAEPAGIAYAVVGLLRAFPFHVARRQLYVPVDILERHQVALHEMFAGRPSDGLVEALGELHGLARAYLAALQKYVRILPPAAISAFLPVALVGPTLGRLEDGNPFAPVELPAWRRQWLIWRAARKPDRITG